MSAALVGSYFKRLAKYQFFSLLKLLEYQFCFTLNDDNHNLDQDDAEKVYDLMENEGLDEDEAIELKDEL